MPQGRASRSRSPLPPGDRPPSTKRRRKRGGNSKNVMDSLDQKDDTGAGVRVDERHRWRRPIVRSPDDVRPRFLDASASVNAGTFGARRLPEIKSLWRTFVDRAIVEQRGGDAAAAEVMSTSGIGSGGVMEGGASSGGGKLSSRHLRRRTGSHRRRRRHRYPRGVVGDGAVGGNDSGGQEEGAATATPANKANATATEEGAAKTTAPSARRSKKEEAKGPATKRPCRRARRKPRFLRDAHRSWHDSDGNTDVTVPDEARTSLHGNDQGSAVDSAVADPRTSAEEPSRHWIETHMWHAKRFLMCHNLFRWSVPLVHSGRGSRAALRLAREKCTLQDATWEVSGQAFVLLSRSINSLTSILGRSCGSMAPFLSDRAVLTGQRTGEAVLHEADAFPRCALGPATFLFGRDGSMPEDGEGIGDCTGEIMNIYVQILVHPSIQDQVYSVLTSLVSSANGACEGGGNFVVGPSLVPGGLSLLRVRGSCATRSVVRALKLKPAMRMGESRIACGAYDWDVVKRCDSAHGVLPHGTVLSMTVEESAFVSLSGLSEKCESIKNESNKDEPEDTLMELVEAVEDQILDSALLPSSLSLEGGKLLLISHRPNNLDSKLQHNIAVCGWDVLCHPSAARAVFLALNQVGVACAIGLAEDGYARMEAEPPLLIFPRDYPDTEQGRLYWNPCDRSGWVVVRECLEGEWGRSLTGLKRVIRNRAVDAFSPSDNLVGVAVSSSAADSVDHCYEEGEMQERENNFFDTVNACGELYIGVEWSAFSKPSPQSAGTAVEVSEVAQHSDGASPRDYSVVVVRGAFGGPFVQAFVGCGHVPFQEGSKSNIAEEMPKKLSCRPRRRPRRRRRPPYECSRALQLSREEAIAHQAMCSTLQTSLSLPAVLCCHLIIDGRGTISPGAAIYECSCAGRRKKNHSEVEGNLLGISAGGCFSPSRGRNHAIGFVGGSRLLRVLSCKPNSIVIVSPEGTKRIALRVLVRNQAPGSIFRRASLSLLS